MTESPVTILVAGCGSAGTRHARTLRKLGVKNLLLFDPDQNAADRLALELSATNVNSVDQGLESNPDGLIVASPPNHHLGTANLAIESGINCFVEKPLADSLDGLEELLRRADRKGLFITVGYNFRYFAPLVELKHLITSGELGRIMTIRAEFGQYLPTWRMGTDYRSNYITSESNIGGIILEESHEFDYVKWLAGPVESVYCASGRLSDLEMELEDTALVIMRHSNGVLSHISVDCTQHGYERGARVVGTEGTVTWEFPSMLSIVRRGGAREARDLGADLATAYELEMSEFLGCIRDSARPRVDGWDALESLQITLAARESATSGNEVRI